MPEETAHRVTISDLYEKVESEGNQQRQELSGLRSDIQLLLDRDKRDYERLDRLEVSLSWLQRTVYAIGVPIVALISGYEAVSRFMV